MTLVTQPEPAAALRASSTCTCPREPLMVPPPTVFPRVPRLPASAGTVMDRNPPVTVTVAVVSPGAAEAGSAAPRVSIPATAAIRTPGRSWVCVLLFSLVSPSHSGPQVGSSLKASTSWSCNLTSSTAVGNGAAVAFEGTRDYPPLVTRPRLPLERMSQVRRVLSAAKAGGPMILSEPRTLLARLGAGAPLLINASPECGLPRRPLGVTSSRRVCHRRCPLGEPPTSRF
jgi:hypothetical protein